MSAPDTKRPTPRLQTCLQLAKADGTSAGQSTEICFVPGTNRTGGAVPICALTLDSMLVAFLSENRCPLFRPPLFDAHTLDPRRPINGVNERLNHALLKFGHGGEITPDEVAAFNRVILKAYGEGVVLAFNVKP